MQYSDRSHCDLIPIKSSQRGKLILSELSCNLSILLEQFINTSEANYQYFWSKLSILLEQISILLQQIINTSGANYQYFWSKLSAVINCFVG